MAKYKQEVIFGIRAVIEAIEEGSDIDKVSIRQGNRGDLFQQLFSMIREKEIPFQYVPEGFFKSFEGRNHQGVVAEVTPIPYAEFDACTEKLKTSERAPLVLVLDRITDVRNFGAIVRSAECAGVDFIVIPCKNSAKISSDAIKTSAGALYHMPVCRENNLRRALKALKFAGLKLYAATEKGSVNYTQVPMNEGCCIVMGSEDVGIAEELLLLTDAQVRIPLLGKIDSLNVSAATAVMLYEAIRQRG